MNSELLLIYPCIIPITTAAFCFLFQKNFKLTSWVSIIGSVFTLLFSILLITKIIGYGPQATVLGNWPAPFGVSFVADLFSAIMVLIAGIIGLVIVLYSMADLAEKPSFTLYHMLFHILISGVNGAFLTGDIFNLYVWFEVMLISSFGLMSLDAGKVQIDGAFKYVILNLISTLFFLLAVALLYGATGSLNLAELHLKVSSLNSNTAKFIASLFLFCFAIKSALFPLFAWLPASYHTMPSAVVALFAALLTKVGVYALIRIFTLVLPLDQFGLQNIMLVIAGLTMLTGVLGAAIQFNIKRILSFHIISQIGYMIMGLALYTKLALVGTVFYLIHHIIVKANLFLIGGLLTRKYATEYLQNMGNVYKSTPFLAALFIIPAFSLAGFPPLSGFWGKFIVIKASLLRENYMLAGTALFVGLLTIYSMMKIWNEAFWKPTTSKPYDVGRKISWLYYFPIITLCSLTIIIGIMPETFFSVAEEAVKQLYDPSLYVTTVLNEQR